MKLPRKTKKSAKGAFVLMIGDEGAVLVQLQKKKVIKRLFAQSPEPMHVREFEKLLDASPASPVTVLFDVMDQSYVRQTLPPVSSLSVNKIVTRRLNKDFSPEDIKGYVLLDREKTGRKDWNYMMVSLAASAIIQKWLIFAIERSNPFKGMGLLPLETQRLLKSLEKEFLKGKEKGAKPLEWQIFVSHNKVGGFRQVVLKNGKLIFTRMTQPFGESTPEVIAGNIEQETINTIEYMKRFGLQDPALANLTIVCADAIKASIDPVKLRVGEYHFFTPLELAILLSLKDAAQTEDSFGDVVISAFIASKKKLVLPLHTPYTQKLGKLYTFILITKIIGALATLGILGWTGDNFWEASQHDIDKLEQEHKRIEGDLTTIKNKESKLPKNTNIYADIKNITEFYLKDFYDLNGFVANVQKGITHTALVTDMHWSQDNLDKATPSNDTRKVSADLQMHFVFAAPEPDSRIPGDVKLLGESLKANLPKFDITMPEITNAKPESSDIKTVIGEGSATAVKPTDTYALDNNVLKVSISGPSNAKPGNDSGGGNQLNALRMRR